MRGQGPPPPAPGTLGRQVTLFRELRPHLKAMTWLLMVPQPTGPPQQPWEACRISLTVPLQKRQQMTLVVHLLRARHAKGTFHEQHLTNTLAGGETEARRSLRAWAEEWAAALLSPPCMVSSQCGVDSSEGSGTLPMKGPEASSLLQALLEKVDISEGLSGA